MSPTSWCYINHRTFGKIGDYLARTKPRVMSLVVFTAMAGLLVAPASVDVVTAIAVLLCIATGTGRCWRTEHVV